MTAGSSLQRVECIPKLTGEAKFIDDIDFPGVIHGATVRTPAPCGTLKGFTLQPGVPWDEFTIITAEDIPAGHNFIAHITDDQPCLVERRINHADEAVLLLAHPDKQLLQKALPLVKLDIEQGDPVLTIEDSLSRRRVVWGADNVFKSFTIEKGDVEKIFTSSDIIIVEGEYRTGAQEQMYIEPNGMVARADGASVTVWGSMQCPYYVHKSLAKMFSLPDDMIRVVQTVTGGAFGGKEDYPSMLACHAALLARKSGRHVKMIYSRGEDMAATTKRHPSLTRHRTAVTRDGRILAMDIEFILDGGAYVTMSPVVLSRGAIHAAGPYFCPDVRIRARAVATNYPPHGAFRGFGAPQSFFAMERQMDRIAAKIGMQPDELRRRNFIKKGQAMATGQLVRDNVDMEGLLERALKEADYHCKRRRFDAGNPASPVKRGIGFSCFMHGGGFTGYGETFLSSIAAVEAAPDGRVRVLASSTEMGQGANTVFTQIAAGALGLPFSMIEVAQPDTSIVPNSGPTVASRTTMIVGKLVENAALGIKQTLLGSGLLREGYTASQFSEACALYIKKSGHLKSLSQYKKPEHMDWDDKTYRGDAYGTYSWAVYVADVSIDTVTYETRVEDFVALQEVGKVVNPVLAEGQVQGGVLQGIGHALCEEVLWKNGHMINNRFTNYIIPTAADAPPIRVFFEEDPYAHGPGGAKGLGELPMDGPAPAILNAVMHATGADIRSIPMQPEHLMKALEDSKEGGK